MKRFVEKNLRNILVGVITFVLIVVLKGCISSRNSHVSEVARSDYGTEARTKQYQVSIGDSGKETIEIQVSSRKYDKKQLKKKFQEAMDELDEVILGENESSEKVMTNLNLVTALPEYPFQISWELSRYDVLDSKGQIYLDELRKVDSKGEGVLVTLTGILNYEGEEAVYERDVLLIAPKLRVDIYEQLLQQVTLEDEASREEEKLTLPTQVQGKPVTWEELPDYTLEQLVVLGIVGAVCYVFWGKEQEKKKDKAKKEEMLMDYPEIIGQLTMLMEAGMTSKTAWKKITDDYKLHKIRTGKIRLAYEEMLYIWQEMQSGVPEAQCYEHFADRMELAPYMKMGALLSQNLRKGTKGLGDMLSMEAIEAMEERRNRAKRLGEEAGTKLMIPMVMMLIVVMIIVVVPAFMSIQI